MSNTRPPLHAIRLSSRDNKPAISAFRKDETRPAQSRRLPRTVTEQISEDVQDDSHSESLALRTRTSVEKMLSDANLGKDVSISLRDLAAAGRLFPDIAQCEADGIPQWAMSDIRRANLPLASKYVFVKNPDSSEKDGLYHVQLMHGAATVLVSRVSRFQGRVILDPLSITPDEFDGACLSFLKTNAYLTDPIGSVHIRDMQDSPELRQSLIQQFVHAAKENPFGKSFGGDVASEDNIVPSSTTAKVPVTHRVPRKM